MYQRSDHSLHVHCLRVLGGNYTVDRLGPTARNVGGKIGIARHEDHIAVALFVGIGLLHLNEVAMGLGHRAI